jgi:hypothetical protein
MPPPATVRQVAAVLGLSASDLLADWRGLVDATAADIRRAIDRVNGWADDVSADRAEADRVVASLHDLNRVQLAESLIGAGLEGVRMGDHKNAMLRRLHNRLTARVRARERAEV